jgi:hypothetical protein
VLQGNIEDARVVRADDPLHPLQRIQQGIRLSPELAEIVGRRLSIRDLENGFERSEKLGLVLMRETKCECFDKSVSVPRRLRPSRLAGERRIG